MKNINTPNAFITLSKSLRTNVNQSEYKFVMKPNVAAIQGVIQVLTTSLMFGSCIFTTTAWSQTNTSTPGLNPSQAMFDVKGKVAVITGASGAFGALAARVLSAAGCKLVLSAGKNPLVNLLNGFVRPLKTLHELCTAEQ